MRMSFLPGSITLRSCALPIQRTKNLRCVQHRNLLFEEKRSDRNRIRPFAKIASDTLGELEQTAGSIPSPDGVSATMKQIAKTPFVHLAGILACVYVGIEFTIGSWAVTFIIEERGGNSDSGYISTGFFGGLMMGRVLHVFVAKVLSEQVAVLSYIVIALALQIVSMVERVIVAVN